MLKRGNIGKSIFLSHASRLCAARLPSSQARNLLLKRTKKSRSVVWNWYGFAFSDQEQTTPCCKVCLKAASA